MMFFSKTNKQFFIACLLIFVNQNVLADFSKATTLNDCAELKIQQINKQSNLKAALLNQLCQGETVQNGLKSAKSSLSTISYKGGFDGSELNLITTPETFPAITQAGSVVWGEGSTIVSVYNDTSGAPDSFSGISVSTNGGTTFDKLVPNPFDTLFTSDSGSPAIAYDDNAGLWLALAISTDCGAQSIGLMSSATPEVSASWIAETCVHAGVADDRPMLWVDNNTNSAFYGRRYISYNDFNDLGTLKVLWFDSLLGTWNDVVVAQATQDPTTMAITFIRNVNIAGKRDGTDGFVYIFAMDEAGGAGASPLNWMYRSEDGGVTWTGVQHGSAFPAVGAGLCAGSDYFYMVPPNWRHMGWGQGAVGPGGILHYVFARESQTPDDIGDVFYTRSSNDGANWSAPIHLNTDQDNKNNVVQWQPSISVTDQGLVLAAWYDRRNTTDGLNYQYYGRQSLDNGLTWEADKPISDIIIPQATQFDPLKESCFAGESNIHNSLSNNALVTWTDGRNTQPDGNMVEQAQMDVYIKSVPLCPAIGVSPGKLPNGEFTVSYTQSLMGVGGTGPYTFSLSGLLPSGLVFEENNPGEITGVPDTTGNFFFSVIATDSFGCQGSEDFGVVVDPAAAQNCPVITLDPVTLLDGAQGAEEMQLITATGGTEPYSYIVTEGVLPLGVILDSVTGDLTGVPQESSAFNFDITATDTNQCTGTQTYTQNIACPMITLSPPSQLPDAAAGFPYLSNITANGGTAPYKFFPQSATPTGIYYSEGGTVFGVAEKGGTKNTTIGVIDANGCLGDQSFRLDSTNCPPGALFCDKNIDMKGDPLAIPVAIEPNFTTTNVCGGEAEWFESTGCASSDDIGHTPAAHARWAIPPVSDGLEPPTFTEDCNSYGTTATQNVLESQVFDVTNCNSGEVKLNFNYLISFEEDATFDRARVEVTADGAPAEVVADNGMGLAVCSGLDSPGLGNLKLWSGWQHLEVIHPASNSFQFNFIAETENGMNNAGEGFFIDDVVLQCSCPIDFVMMPDVLPVAGLNEAYAETITSEGGQPVVTFGTLPGSPPPPGLTLDSDSGALFGIPTTPGVYPFTIEATDDNACQVSTIYNFIVGPAGCPDITFTPDVVPDGDEGTFYAASPVASGGTDPYEYVVSAGMVPPGLSLNTATGTISGTPTTPGVYPFTISVIDSLFCDGGQDFNINISPIGCPAISIDPTILPNPDTRLAYSEAVMASGGSAPYQYAVTGGSLPLGLSLDTVTGEIFGTPSSGGAFSFDITAVDQNSCLGVQNYSQDVFGCPAINLLPESFPTGVNTLPYDQTVVASGGLMPYSYSVNNGALPTGLSLDAMSGSITGIPTVTGLFNFDIAVADGNQCTGLKSYSILIDPPPCPTIILSPATFTDAILGTVYSETVSSTGGLAPYTYAVTTSALPDGLSLSPAGVISGVPVLAGIFNFDITTTDANGCIGVMNYSIIASEPACPTFAFTPSSLPDANSGVAYSQIVATTNGLAPYNYTVSSGALPSGFTLDPATGEISGTSTTGGIFNFDITSQDANLCTGVMSYSITNIGCPTIGLSPLTLTNAVATVGYSQIIQGSGSTNSPYTYSVSSGALPVGMMLDPTTGELSGAPEASGVYNFDVTAADTASCSGINSYTLIVDSAPCPTIVLAPDVITTEAIIGSNYSQPLVASGGVAPYDYSISSGTLPDGLMINPITGEISGIATTAGLSNFEVTVSDVNGCSLIKNYSLVASEPGCPTITISPATLTGGLEGDAYSGTVTASGGVGPYTYTVSAGALPSGLSLDANSGAITGIPTAGGVFNFDITAEDTNGCFGSQSHSLSITSTALEIIFKDGFESPL